MPSWRAKAVLGWCGMRGAVSLAAALALPLTTDAGDAFPDRDLIVFLTFCVILATLLLQGLTLPALIQALDLDDGGLAEKEEAKARIHASEAALARLEELVDEDWVREDTAERMRGLVPVPPASASARASTPTATARSKSRSLDYQRLRRELLDAERRAVARAPPRAGRSTTRSCAASTATSTSRTSASTHDEGSVSPDPSQPARAGRRSRARTRRTCHSCRPERGPTRTRRTRGAGRPP